MLQDWARYGYRSVLTMILVGCSGSVSAGPDDAVLERYRSSDGYGSVAFSRAGKDVPEEVMRYLEDYARSRGIRVVQGNEGQAETLIVLAPSASGKSLSAARYSESKQIDVLETVPATMDGAKLVIDELLLLWHPPKSNSTRRAGTMDYALEPTFYTPRWVGFGSLFRRKYFMGCNNQRLLQLDSITPTFRWESFPRSFDIAAGLDQEDYRDVVYQFRLVNRGSNESFVVTDLTEPTYTADHPLNFCQVYSWSVRAVFTLNGVPRQSEWAGFYYKHSKPWYVRRGLDQHWWDSGHDACPYILVTPKSPFDDSCDPHQSIEGSPR